MKCKYKESCGYEFCMDDFCPEYEVAVETNADRIRAMTDEELAKSPFFPCPYDLDDDGYGECKYGWHERKQTCEECKLEWLQQPAEGE